MPNMWVAVSIEKVCVVPEMGFAVNPILAFSYNLYHPSEDPFAHRVGVAFKEPPEAG